MTMNYAKLSIKAMVDYLDENKADDKELLKGFRAAANPQSIKGEDGKETKKYNVKDAKRYFYKNLKGEIEFENPPKLKKRSAWDIMSEWD